MDSQQDTPPVFIRRRKKLIDKSLQLRMVGAFLAVGSIACLFQVILMNNSILALSRNLGEQGEQVLRLAPGSLARTLLVTMGILIPVTAVVGLLVTHRVAGPAYRMRMYLQDIAENGAPDRPCKVRKGDELQDLCELLNRAIESVVAGPQDEQEVNPEEQVSLEEAPALFPGEDSSEVAVAESASENQDSAS